VIALISLAYIEEDGVLLSIALLADAIVLTLVAGAIWEMLTGAKWIIDLWQRATASGANTVCPPESRSG